MNYLQVLNAYLEKAPEHNVLSPQDRAHIISHSQMISLKTEEVLYTPKTPAAAMYFLARGSLMLHLHDQRVFLVKEGMSFGEEAALGLRFYHSKALAKNDVHLLQIPAEDVQDVLERNPSLQKTFLDLFSQKITGTYDSGKAVEHPTEQHSFLTHKTAKTIEKQKERGDNLEKQHIASSSLSFSEKSHQNEAIGWIASILIPLFVYLASKGYWIEQNPRFVLPF